MEGVTNASPENLVERVLTYSPRPLSEFHKYDVLEMLETLHNKAADSNHEKRKYYRFVFYTAREKVETPKEQFKTLILRLLGDKDHERVLQIVAKVEKANREESTREIESRVGGEARSSRSSHIRCFHCNRKGHVRANCPDRMSDLRKVSQKSEK